MREIGFGFGMLTFQSCVALGRHQVSKTSKYMEVFLVCLAWHGGVPMVQMQHFWVEPEAHKFLPWGRSFLL